MRASQAEDHLSRYGKQLLAHIPTEATDLFIDLCCGTLDRPQTALAAPDVTKTSSFGFASYLSRGSTVSPAPAAPAPAMAATRSDDFARKAANRRSGIYPQGASVGPDDEPAAPSPAPQVPLPQLRQFFAFFADHPVQFVRFLETVARRRWGSSAANGTDPDGAGLGIHTDDDQVQEQESVWNTLLDLYLQTSSSAASVEERAAIEAKALSLLSSSKCEPTQALIVCVTYDFVPGIVLLYERLGLVDDVVRFWIERASDPSASSASRSEASRSAIDAVRRFGAEHPHLYVLALRFLTSSGEMLDRHRADLVEVLEKIDEGKVVPPITVVQTLAKSGVASVGTVKAYLLKQITAQRQEIDSVCSSPLLFSRRLTDAGVKDRGLIESYRAETAKKRAEIKELSDPDAPRIFQVTRCSACGGQLDLPAVHFMCKHSYHQRCVPSSGPRSVADERGSCLGANEAECRTCALSHGLIRDIRRNNEKLADRHDLFLEEVRDSDDGCAPVPCPSLRRELKPPNSLADRGRILEGAHGVRAQCRAVLDAAYKISKQAKSLSRGEATREQSIGRSSGGRRGAGRCREGRPSACL